MTLAKIGNCFVVDPTKEEEQCTVAQVTVGVNQSGKVCGVHKTGVGGIASSALVDMLACAQKVGSDLLNILRNASKDTVRGMAAVSGEVGRSSDDDMEERKHDFY